MVLSSIFVIGSLAAAAQFTVAPFSPDTFAVAERSRNLIELHDTAAWQRFGGKLAACAESDSAQVSIVHIGDSHLQADFFSCEMRRCLHKMTGRPKPRVYLNLKGKNLNFIPFALTKNNEETGMVTFVMVKFSSLPASPSPKKISIRNQPPPFNTVILTKYSKNAVTNYNP